MKKIIVVIALTILTLTLTPVIWGSSVPSSTSTSTSSVASSDVVGSEDNKNLLDTSEIAQDFEEKWLPSLMAIGASVLGYLLSLGWLVVFIKKALQKLNLAIDLSNASSDTKAKETSTLINATKTMIDTNELVNELNKYSEEIRKSICQLAISNKDLVASGKAREICEALKYEEIKNNNKESV